MKVATMGRAFMLGGLLALGLAGPARGLAAPAGQAAVARQDFQVNFGDFQSNAELTYPAAAPAGSPTVILIHGSTPADMDFDVSSPAGAPLSHIFKDIAAVFPAHGVAVLRYNKHYVTSATQVDYAKYAALNLQQFQKDAEQVLIAAEHNPHVDAKHIYLYGWSEGSTVAAALVAAHPEVAGLIVQGPVAVSWRDTFLYQVLDVVLPYARSFSTDGKISAATLQQAFTGNGGLVAKGELIFFIDPSFQQTHQVAVNSYLDANKDGLLDPETEIEPGIGRVLDAFFAPGGPFYLYSPGQALPTVTEQAPHLRLPVLILQGENDANVPAAGARTLAAALAANPDHTLQVYPGLGHSLGPAAGPIDDNFRPIAAAPMDDTVAWVLAHSAAAAPPAGMPVTGASRLDGVTAGLAGVALLLLGLGLRRRARRPSAV